jgi:hypothetical protein
MERETVVDEVQPLSPPDAKGDLASVHAKLDEILDFQRKLAPFLPLLVKAVDFLDNPASRFRDSVGWRKRDKQA